VISRIRSRCATWLRPTGWRLIQRNWDQAKAEIKTTWGKLSEDDFLIIAGDREKLVQLLHCKYEGDLLLAERKVEQFVERMERVLNSPLAMELDSIPTTKVAYAVFPRSRHQPSQRPCS
jgi:uncharacterized protein YjbJ (UPF0337 family)